jgi:hypothetical protein
MVRARARSLIAVVLSTAFLTSHVRAADLHDGARIAYDTYVARATRAFLQQLVAPSEGERSGREATHDGEVTVKPGGEDGIISVDGGLVHHWTGTSFVTGVTLDQALAVSVAYDQYPKLYKEIVSSRLLDHDGNTYRIKFRIKESAAGRTIVLEITSRVVYAFPRAGVVSSVANAEEVREVADAGTPRERYLPAGHDSGYLWRAATLTALVSRGNGVAIAMETIGLSRAFPPMLGWVIEPIARRFGRKSVEQSLLEFDAALRTHSPLARDVSICCGPDRQDGGPRDRREGRP